MRIYADPSFLVSYLYAGDRGNPAARAFFRQHSADEWLTTEWSTFETENSLRQLCRAPNGPRPEVPEALRRLFKHWHDRGRFEAVTVNLNESLHESRQLSAAHGASLRMRSADVLHVAMLEQILPDLFVTRDQEQHALAVTRMFPAALVP